MLILFLSLGDSQLLVESKKLCLIFNVHHFKAHNSSTMMWLCFVVIVWAPFCTTLRYFSKLKIMTTFPTKLYHFKWNQGREWPVWVAAHDTSGGERKQELRDKIPWKSPSRVGHLFNRLPHFHQSATIKLYYGMLQQEVCLEPILWCL